MDEEFMCLSEVQCFVFVHYNIKISRQRESSFNAASEEDE
jgi:hypothetical protein